MNWKKQWKKELNSIAPPLDDRVKREPIPTRDEEKLSGWQAFKKWLFAHRSRIYACASACLALIMTACITLPTLFRDEGKGTSTNESPSKTPQSLVFALEINPSALFTVDHSGKIVAVVAANQDADVLLSAIKSETIEGKSLSEGVHLYTDYAFKFGYLQPTDGAVRISGCGNNTILHQVQETVKEYFKEKGLKSVVFSENVTLLRLSERTNVPLANTIEEATQEVAALPERFAERQAMGKTEDELEESYWEFVSVESVKGYAYDLIEAEYGFAASLLLQQLEELFTAVGEVSQTISQLMAFLSDLGLETTGIYQAPVTEEEYLDKTAAYALSQATKRETDNKSVYEEVRPQLSTEEYENYLTSIVAEYGSLQAYWEILKNI